MISKKDNYDLSSHNTFRMKVSCRSFVEVTRPEDLEAVSFRSLPEPLFVMGGGSNLLFTGDFPGTVLHYAEAYIRVENRDEDSGEVIVKAGGGTLFDDLCSFCCAEGFWGTENLSLIPGEVGASAVQNIGAYGVEAKDIICGIHAFDLERGVFVDIDPKDCGYGYRTSFFKTIWKGRFIITSVSFRLSLLPDPRLDYGGIRKAIESRYPGETLLTPRMVRDTVVAVRNSKLPDPAVLGSAGSFFCNPVIPRGHFEKISRIAEADNGTGYSVPHYDTPDGVKVPAAWMIDQCGLKGRTVGGAMVYPSQPLVIVNATGEALPEDILSLENLVISSVRNKYGVSLHPEVEHVGTRSPETK